MLMIMGNRQQCGMLIGLMGLWISSRDGGVCLRSIKSNTRGVFDGSSFASFCSCCDSAPLKSSGAEIISRDPQ